MPNTALEPLRGEKPQLGGPAEPASRECHPAEGRKSDTSSLILFFLVLGSTPQPRVSGRVRFRRWRRDEPAAGAEPCFGSIQQLLMVADPTGSAFQGNKTLAAQLFGVFGAQSETAPGSSSASLQGAVMHPAMAPQ